MQPFTYVAITRQGDALTAIASDQKSKFLAGGTNLLDDMKLGVETPAHLIDITGLPLDKIESLPDGGLRVGATVRNSDLAWNDQVRQKGPGRAQELLSGA